MTKEKTEIIQNYLPKNWANVVAKEMDVTPAYVRLVKNGERENDTIMECIYLVAHNNKVALNKKKSRFRMKLLKKRKK